MKKSVFACAAVLLLWTGAADRLAAKGWPKRFTLWDINLGDSAATIPNEYVNYACGTNGGPPSIPLKDFTAFKKCRPDPMGLHEVYFQYDDELEYQARALDIKPEIRMYAGTTIFEFPIVASILFDNDGKVRGERAVTDPRQQVARKRDEFWELGTFLRQRFGDAGWKCVNLPPAGGENPVGGIFIKSNCEKTIGSARLIVEQRFLEKKGQEAIDPVTGKPNLQAFESSTRFEEYDASLPPPADGPK